MTETVVSNILFVADRSEWSDVAEHALARVFPGDVVADRWEHGIDDGRALPPWRGDWIVCFKSDVIIPLETLACARVASVNIHPGPPSFRGVGGYEWAIETGQKEFGVTCHLMVAAVDSGPILSALRFPVLERESVESLRSRTAIYALYALAELVPFVARGSCPASLVDERWSGPLHTWTELARRSARLATSMSAHRD